MFLKVLLLLLIPLLASGELKPFRCNSPEEVREMDIKQVFEVNNDTYVLRRNQLIRFKAPFCFFNSQKKTVCAISQAFEIDNSKFKSRAGNVKLKGFFYTSTTTVVVYENLGDKKLEGHLISIDPWSLDLLENSDILIVDKNNDYIFSGEIFALHYKLETRKVTISYELNKPNLLNLDLVVNGARFNGPKRVDFTLSNLMAYQRYPSGIETFLVFDEISSKLHISFFETGKNQNEIQMQTRPIDFAELFNCPKKLETENDLKGIFFFGGTFWIFIKRLYLAVQEDLLATRFTITDEHYRGPKMLSFPEPEEVFINLDLKKFVKEAEENFYFVALDSIFKLEASDGNLVGTLDKGPDQLMECEHSTVDQKGDLFCFAPEKLFICSSDAKPISYASLFSGTGVRFDASDRVEVAFGHLESIILMTRTHYYTFSKDSLELKGPQITLRSSSEKPVTKSTHYLFQKPNQTGSSSTLLLWLMMILVLSILLLVAYLRADDIRFFFQKRNRSNKPSPIKFEKRNLGGKEKEKSRKSP